MYGNNIPMYCHFVHAKGLVTHAQTVQHNCFILLGADMPSVVQVQCHAYASKHVAAAPTGKTPN